MMNISSRGLNLIKQQEGFSSIPYECPAGKMTIGYGHVILPHEIFTAIDMGEANKILSDDLVGIEGTINHLVTVPINQNQFDALCSFTYNLGVGNLRKSTLLRKINDGSFDEAAEQFDRWIYSKDRILPGLIARRKAEKELFMEDS